MTARGNRSSRAVTDRAYSLGQATVALNAASRPAFNSEVLQQAAPTYNAFMEFGISTQIYRKQAVTVDVLETIRRAGFERFELFCNRPHFDFHDRSLMRSIGRWFHENTLPAPSIHLPFLENVGSSQKVWISILEPERRHREAAMDEIKRSLELAEHVKPAYVVMHWGNPGESFTPAAFEYAYAAVSQIRRFAGVDLMIENIPNEISTIERIEEFKAVAQVSDLGICYDTGHGHLQRNTKSFESVRATHVHDNNGESDEHLWPFEGTLNWPSLIDKLILADYKGPLMFETRGDLAKSGEVRSRLDELWDEASTSAEEFRMKYKLNSDNENEAHLY